MTRAIRKKTIRKLTLWRTRLRDSCSTDGGEKQTSPTRGKKRGTWGGYIGEPREDGFGRVWIKKWFGIRGGIEALSCTPKRKRNNKREVQTRNQFSALYFETKRARSKCRGKRGRAV